MHMTTILAILGALAAGPVPAVQDSVRPVTGHWRYNSRESDQPRRPMPGQADSTGQGPGGMPGGRGGSMGPRPGAMPGGMGPGGPGGMGGGMAPRGGGPPSPEEMQRRVTLMSFAFDAPDTLELEEGSDTFTIVERRRLGPDTLVLPTNWRKVERRLEDDVRVELRSRRQDGRLTVERKVSGAGKLTETYYLARDGTQLFVLVRLEPNQSARGGPPGGPSGGPGGIGEQGEGGERGPQVFRRVYDRAGP